MKPAAPAGIRGEFQPIATGQPGLSVSEHLPRFATVIGQFAQVRSVNHRMKNHNSATYYSLTGHAPPLDDIRLRDTQELYPAYGSTVAKLRPAEDRAVPSFVSFPHVLRDGSVTPGQHASFLGKEFDPFFIGQDPSRSDFRLPELSLPSSLSLDRLEDRRGLQRIDRPADRPRIVVRDRPRDRRFLQPGVDDAQLTQGEAGVRPLARARQAPRRLRPDTPTARAVCWRDGWSKRACGLFRSTTPSRSAARATAAGTRMATISISSRIGLLPITDMAVPTLIEDLQARGLLEETLVVWMGEFGRTPKVENTKQFGPDGRGHWPNCYTVLLAGGGITPGAIYGSSDRIGAYPATDPVSPDDIAATMFWALGIDPATEVTDTLGRPLAIAAGKPITRLFG